MRRAGAEGWRTLDFRCPQVRAAHNTMIELAAQAAAGALPDEEAPEETQDEGSPMGETDEGALAAMKPLPDESAQTWRARIGGMLTRQTNMVLRRAAAGHPLDRRQVAALSTMVQLTERIAALAGDRIVYLARELAGQILVEHGMSEGAARAAVAVPVLSTK
ncbi:hypothetical protein GCM10007937_44990 [Mesorhizobium albiziae]|nr:hypothetical protein GCM10007937_44990 [Mesorhizobium albiziae]